MIQTKMLACRHHWLLCEPRQGVVRGVCKRCGTRREYPACPEWSELYDDYDEMALTAPVGRVLRRVAERLGDEQD